MVEIRKPPNFKVIDEICVGPLALHRRSRLERQDSANCNATSAAAIRNGSFTSLMGQGGSCFGVSTLSGAFVLCVLVRHLMG